MSADRSAATCVVAYDKIAHELEEREVAAGVAPGSWRWMSAVQWTAVVTRGLQRRAALEERAGRDAARGEVCK